MMEIRPRCYVATTNTASGTPESYLAKSLRYSQDSHEIAKDEPQMEVSAQEYERWLFKETKDEPQTCDTCKFELYCPEMCEGCCEWDSHYEPKYEL